MDFHPDVLAAHAQFGGDLEDLQRRYDGISPEVLALARACLCPKEATPRLAPLTLARIARTIIQERADHAAKDKRIREDERDRLYEKAAAEATDKTAMGRRAFAAAVWLSVQDAMGAADRSDLREEEA